MFSPRRLVTFTAPRIPDGALINLEELRLRLASRIALLIAVSAGCGIWWGLTQEAFPLLASGLWATVLGLSLGARLGAGKHPMLARHALVWGCTAVLLLAMGLFAHPWLPILGVLLAFVAALLVRGGEFVTSTAIAVTMAWLYYAEERAYPLPMLMVALALSAALASTAVRTLYTAAGWAWHMQQRADELLEQARTHRAELSRALRSLETAYATQQRIQRELVVARKQADEARRMKEQFAANISHELRTPLNLILGFSEVMYLSPEVYGELAWPRTLRRDVYQIYHSSRHLLEMIDDILDLSRFEMTGFTLNREPTPAEPLLRGTVEIAEDLFRSRPVRFEAAIDPQLPPIEVDRTRIRQVILNLLKNAQRFTTAGVVRLAATYREGSVVISVSDTGPGIPADKLPYIFDEFYQVDPSLRRGHDGAGLGLAISRRFVEAHGGQIWAESEEGAGSTFFFTLPSVPFPQAQGAKRTIERAGSAETRPAIVIVDPDPGVAGLVRRHLPEYEVLHVAGAAQVDSVVRSYHPRAVVRNVLPHELQPGQSITALAVPTITCSLPSQAWMAGDLTAAAILTKPVMPKQLVSELDRLAGVHSILLIDDDRSFGQLVRRMLDTTGRAFSMRHAYTSVDGLSAMRAARPDVVLLDLNTPHMGGLDVLAEMRRDGTLADVPVVLVTGTGDLEDLMDYGTDIVVHRANGVRPVEVLRCIDAISRVLGPDYNERAFERPTIRRQAGAAPIKHPRV